MKCEYCKKEFKEVRAWQKFCSPVCRMAAWAIRKIGDIQNVK